MSREQFEAWYMDNWGFTEDDIETLFERSPDCPEDYYRLGVRLAHHSWLAATQQAEVKCSALAAENAKKSRCLGFFASVIKSGESWTRVCQHEYNEAQETPATDAFLAEVRAQGVEMVIAYHRERADALHHVDRNNAIRHSMAALDASDVAAQLRQEAAQ